MKEYKIDIELHQVGDHEKNDYRLYVSGHLMLERPWNVPIGYSHQVVHLTCNLDKGENKGGNVTTSRPNRI